MDKICDSCTTGFSSDHEWATHCKSCYIKMLAPCAVEGCGNKFLKKEGQDWRTKCVPCWRLTKK